MGRKEEEKKRQDRHSNKSRQKNKRGRTGGMGRRCVGGGEGGQSYRVSPGWGKGRGLENVLGGELDLFWSRNLVV